MEGNTLRSTVTGPSFLVSHQNACSAGTRARLERDIELHLSESYLVVRPLPKTEGEVVFQAAITYNTKSPAMKRELDPLPKSSKI